VRETAYIGVASEVVVDTAFFRPSTEPAEAASLVFMGAMDWLPNEDGILFFADEVLPHLRTMVPSVRLTVVGRNPSRHLRARLQQHREIEVVGRVDDVRPYVLRGSVFVIPLRIGGGTRIKAYEAISGKLGAPGLTEVTGGQIPTEQAINSQVKSDIGRAEGLSMPVLLILMLVIFGSLAAASLPLAIGGAAILGSFALLVLAIDFVKMRHV
jgi:hypothetical protein